MSMPPKHVVRFDLWVDPVFDSHLGEQPGVALQVCATHGDDAAGWQALSQAHVYHVSPARNELPMHWHVTDALLARCPALLCVSSGGAGYDTVDVEACTRAGVAVVNQAGGNAVSVAEHTLGLMIAVSRKIAESNYLLRTHRGFSREKLMGHELNGKTLGIVGIGHTGTITARYAGALGMRVLAYDPLLDSEQIAQRGATAVDLDTLCREADIVSLHCPLDADTRNLFDARRFAAMKPGAIFISTARGGIHDEAALADAVQAGHLAGAGLDVWDPEPPGLDNPLLSMINVVATYHTAGVTHEARRNVAAIAAAQIVDVLAGRRPPRLVNPTVWAAYEERYKRAFGTAR